MAVVPSTIDYHRRVAARMVAFTGGRLSFAECMREGSDLWVHCLAGASLARDIAFEAAQAEAALYLDSATGERLDRLVLDRYGFNRNSASPSYGTVAVWSATPPSVDVVIAPGSVLLTTEGTKLATILEVTIPAGSTAKITTTAQSTIAASGQNVAASTVTGFESPPSAAGATVLASNATADGGTAFAGSADSETDEALRERARKFWALQYRATRAALELGALQVAGIAQATAQETLQWDGTYGGAATLYVADDSGNSSPALEALVRTELEDWRAAGIAVTVTGGSPQYVAVVLDLTLSAGYDLTAVSQNVIAALVAIGKTLAPGATLYYGDLVATVRGVPGVVAAASTVVSPVGDVVPTAANGVLRIRTGDVTFQ